MLSTRMSCPSCGNKNLDIHGYESMIVVSPKCALFTVRCSACDMRVSSLREIPADMREEVQYAAIEVGAGMGRES